MDVVIIGTGNVAWFMAKWLHYHKHQVLQVAGRNLPEAQALANLVQADATSNFSNLSQADVYILAIADTNIAEVANQIKLSSGLLLHTAGSVSIDVLVQSSAACGVMWPMQSIHKNTPLTTAVPLMIEANNPIAMFTLRALANSLSQQVQEANQLQRQQLHVAAVMANNFVNFWYVLANDFCKKQQLDFQLLLPLIQQSAMRLKEQLPHATQTGPAIRGDEATIQQHLLLLSNQPEIKALYSQMSTAIQQYPWPQSKPFLP